MSSPDGFAPQPAERVVARLRPHARVLFWPSVALIAVCALLGYFGGSFSDSWVNLVVLLAAILLIVFLFLLPLAFWLGTRYTVTTRRLVLRHGFFVRVKRDILHSRGYEVTETQGWLQSAFRSGSIHLHSAGQAETAVLKDVPHADQVQAALHDLMENNRSAIASAWQPTTSSLDEAVGGGNDSTDR